MLSKEDILLALDFMPCPIGGIGSWIGENTPQEIFERIGNIDSKPLTKVQLNQLLVLGREAPVSDGFYEYYWNLNPDQHPYKLSALPCEFQAEWISNSTFLSLAHLRWGFYRFYVDALLYFGNVRTAFRELREFDLPTLQNFFQKRAFKTSAMRKRGPALELNQISRDSRHLISEMACKSYGNGDGPTSELTMALIAAYDIHENNRGGRITIGQLLSADTFKLDYKERQTEFEFSATDVLDEGVSSKEELYSKMGNVAKEFKRSREAALNNTRLYLSMVGELDVYVATSMRSRDDFRKMATVCDKVFGNTKLKDLSIR